jgi:hypothetical protein
MAREVILKETSNLKDFIRCWSVGLGRLQSTVAASSRARIPSEAVGLREFSVTPLELSRQRLLVYISCDDGNSLLSLGKPSRKRVQVDSANAAVPKLKSPRGLSG